jgi:Arc/MetJ-type ribon-helix-helix transcriptional regulator
MDASNLELTPAQRAALLAQPDSPVYIADQATRKIYMLCEQGRFPELEEDYVREGLELAREQIRRGETSSASVQEVISKAERRPVS